jgi:hypothetical protein
MVGERFMQQTLTYRAAKTKDIPLLLKMAKDFWDNLTFYDEEFDEDTVIGALLMCKQLDLLFVALINSKIVGFIAAASGPLLANKSVTIATEIAWWVTPEHRNTGAGTGLEEILQKACKDKGIKYLNMICLEQSMPEALKHRYLKEGFRKTETTYSKVII